MNASSDSSTLSTLDFFAKGTDSKLAEKADSLIAGLQEFNSNFNRKLLDLEKGYDFLYLSREVGLNRFRKLMKARFPYTYGDIVNFLSVAELHNRFPQFHEKILALGVSACKELVKASTELVSRLFSTAGTGLKLTDIKKIVSREKKGLAIASTPEHLQQLLVGAVVEVVSDCKYQGWLGEVKTNPDEFGRLVVRLMKTGKSRQVFVDEVQLYDRTRDVDSNAVISPAQWRMLKTQYSLSDSDFETIKEVAYTHAQQSAPEEAATIEVLWKHVFLALDGYQFKPSVVLAAIDADEDEDWDEDEDKDEGGLKEEVRELAEANAQLRESTRHLREELQATQAKLEKAQAENRRLSAAQQQAIVDVVKPEQPYAITKEAVSEVTLLQASTEDEEVRVVAVEVVPEEVPVVLEISDREAVEEPLTIILFHDDNSFQVDEHFVEELDEPTKPIDWSKPVLEVAYNCASLFSY